MIGYTMVGTKDLDRAVVFYDAIFTEMGFTRCFKDDQVSFWGDKVNVEAPRFATGYPFNGESANLGNGGMTAFLIDSAVKIDRLYAIAMGLGGSDEGPPGLRPHYGEGFYAAYLRDPDGNKIAFVCYDVHRTSA
ncbi:VOC family protein [Agrobacterium cavarae]|uniref:VOC family protein n=1 Tax=Agrobacterium cavarae TaxID=2528239 RepID=UPI002FDA5C7D